MSAIDSVELRNRMISAFFLQDWSEIDLHISLYEGIPTDEIGDRYQMAPSQWSVTTYEAILRVENANEILFEDVPTAEISGVALWDSAEEGAVLATVESVLSVTAGETVRISSGVLAFELNEV